MGNNYTIEVTCLFCDAPMKVEEEKKLESGDIIKCSACGELNDYDSLVDVAKEKGVELVKANLEKEIKSKFKKLFK